MDDSNVKMQDASALIVIPDEDTSSANQREGEEEEHDNSPVKRLLPSAQFRAFTLWQPDRVGGESLVTLLVAGDNVCYKH